MFASLAKAREQGGRWRTLKLVAPWCLLTTWVERRMQWAYLASDIPEPHRSRVHQPNDENAFTHLHLNTPLP